MRAGAAGVRFLLVSGQPLGEPIARYGPFVMNTRQEIEQALRETQERIELLQGRKQFLDEHLALSQIDVHLKETRTRGPLMLLWDGAKWLFGKLLWL